MDALDSEFVTNLVVAKLLGEIIKIKYIEYERGWTGEHSSFEILDSLLVKEWENQRALKMLTSVDIASKSGDKKCFSCGKTNHLSNLCPVTNKKSKEGSSLQLALNRARGNITDQVARYNRINLFYKQFQASVRISYKNVP